MGLDMYAWTVPAEWCGDKQVDYKPGENQVTGDLAYWRKFNHLHGWMHKLYLSKGGADPNFNCNTVRLMPEDLDRLERECQDEELFTATSGFFFGSDELDDRDMEALEDFISDAHAAIQSGNAVWYDSWW